jgi:hypothetical protein
VKFSDRPFDFGELPSTRFDDQQDLPVVVDLPFPAVTRFTQAACPEATRARAIRAALIRLPAVEKTRQ